MKYVSLILITLSMAACGGIGDSSKLSELNDNLGNGNGGLKTVDDGAYECEVNYEEFELQAHVLGYTLTDKIEGQLGFNLATGLFKSLYAGMKIEKSEMNMSMGLGEVISPNEEIVYATGTGKGKKNEFKGGLDLGLFKIDLSYFKQTPLFTIADRTVNDSLANIQEKFEMQKLEWKTRIVYSEEDNGEEVLYMPVGTASLVRKGDRFFVWNVAHDWQGQPCASRLLNARKLTREPLAEVEVKDVNGNISQLRVITKNSDEKIRSSARVEISYLPMLDKKDIRTLRRPVRVTDVDSQKLPLGEFGEVDLVPFVVELIKARMDAYGFQPRF